MALHFSNFHHHIEEFDYWIQLICECIQACNFCSMHCSFDKRNYFQRYLHNLVLLLFAVVVFIIFHLKFLLDVTVAFDWRTEIVNLETSKPFSFASRSINH